MSKILKKGEGFHYWTIAAFLNIVSMLFFLLSLGMRPLFLLCGYSVSFISVYLMPYGLKEFGAFKSGRLFLSTVAVVVAFVALMLYALPFSLLQNLAVTLYSSFIPAIVLSLYFLNSKRSLQRELKKKMLSSTLVLVILLCFLRIIFTLHDTSIDAMGERIFLRDWVTVALDNTFTLIYVTFILLNYARLKKEFDESSEELNILEGLLPICAQCKKIRDDEGNWNKLEQYLSTHSEVKFSHGMCPSCVDKMYPHLKDKLRQARGESEK